MFKVWKLSINGEGADHHHKKNTAVFTTVFFYERIYFVLF